MTRTCDDCRFNVCQEGGYSNYTVEGSTFICAKKAHPAGEFDRFYGEDKRLQYGADCPSFEAGEGLTIWVEGGHEDFTPEQQEVYELWQK